MGTDPDRISAAIRTNIEKARDNKGITKHELSELTCIPKSTFYRNMKNPARFTILETGLIAEALDVGLIDILRVEDKS